MLSRKRGSMPRGQFAGYSSQEHHLYIGPEYFKAFTVADGEVATFSDFSHIHLLAPSPFAGGPVERFWRSHFHRGPLLIRARGEDLEDSGAADYLRRGGALELSLPGPLARLPQRLEALKPLFAQLSHWRHNGQRGILNFHLQIHLEELVDLPLLLLKVGRQKPAALHLDIIGHFQPGPVGDLIVEALKTTHFEARELKMALGLSLSGALPPLDFARHLECRARFMPHAPSEAFLHGPPGLNIGAPFFR